LHLAENFGAPTRIATLALAKFQFFLSVTDLFSDNIIAQRSWPPLSISSNIHWIEHFCVEHGRRVVLTSAECATIRQKSTAPAPHDLDAWGRKGSGERGQSSWITLLQTWLKASCQNECESCSHPGVSDRTGSTFHLVSIPLKGARANLGALIDHLHLGMIPITWRLRMTFTKPSINASDSIHLKYVDTSVSVGNGAPGYSYGDIIIKPHSYIDQSNSADSTNSNTVSDDPHHVKASIEANTQAWQSNYATVDQSAYIMAGIGGNGGSDNMVFDSGNVNLDPQVHV
jgi:hypothetical protein